MDEKEIDTITINSGTVDDILNGGTLTALNYSGLTFNNNSSMYGTGYSYPTVTGVGNITLGNTHNSLDVKGDANFDGDIKFKGKSLEELFTKIEDRLAILQPDPKKLEKYEALRKAYEHYKTLERLIGED